MVDHTHEDIDAMFSRFSESLKTNQTFILSHLIITLRNCSSSCPTLFLLTKVVDFKSYVEGHDVLNKEQLVRHQRPLQF